jgi:hypothetical protein
MPVSWERHGGVLVVTTSGRYLNEEVDRALTEAAGDPAHVAGTPVVFDSRDSAAPLTKPDIAWRREALIGLPRRGFSSRCAIVTGPQRHRYGVARMLEMTVELSGIELRIFSDLSEALAWLTPKPSR